MNKWVDAILSWILPGLGHIIENEYKKGIIFLVIFLIVYGLSWNIGVSVVGIILTIINLFLRFYTAYEAYKLGD